MEKGKNIFKRFSSKRALCLQIFNTQNRTFSVYEIAASALFLDLLKLFLKFTVFQIILEIRFVYLLSIFL